MPQQTRARRWPLHMLLAFCLALTALVLYTSMRALVQGAAARETRPFLHLCASWALCLLLYALARLAARHHPRLQARASVHPLVAQALEKLRQRDVTGARIYADGIGFLHAPFVNPPLGKGRETVLYAHSAQGDVAQQVEALRARSHVTLYCSDHLLLEDFSLPPITMQDAQCLGTLLVAMLGRGFGGANKSTRFVWRDTYYSDPNAVRAPMGRSAADAVRGRRAQTVAEYYYINHRGRMRALDAPERLS